MSEKRERERRRQRSRDRQRQTKQVTGRRSGFSVLDLSKASGDIEFFKPAKETYIIDFVPFEVTTDALKLLRDPDGNKIGIEVGDLEYKLEVPIHRDVGPENKQVLCRTLAFGQDCFICEQKSGLDWPKDKKEIQALSAQWRNMYNIKVKEPTGKENTVLLWDVAYKTFESEMLDEIREVEAEEEREIFVGGPEEDISSVKFRGFEKFIPADPEQGRDKPISFTGFKSFHFVERDEDLSDEIMDQAYPLDLMLTTPTYEYVKNLFLGIDTEEGEERKEEPEEQEPASKRTTPSKSEKDDIPPDDKKEETKPAGGWDDLGDMDSDQMLTFMKQQKLKIRGAPRMKERELRKALKELRPSEKKEKEKEKEKEKGNGGDGSFCPVGYVEIDGKGNWIFLEKVENAGENCDKYPECDKCEVWQQCASAQQALQE